MKSSARAVLKRLYLGIPFKKQIFSLVRKVWTPPWPIMQKLVFEGSFEVPIPDGRTVVLNHTFSQIETEMFWEGIVNGWEKTSLTLWLKLARRAKIIVDAGSNTGIYALAAEAVNPDATILAFEPMPRIHQKLINNCALNGSRIICERAALSNYDGDATMYDLPNSNHTYGGTLNKNLYATGLGASPITVIARRLETILTEQHLQRLDLLKIDVESHEPAVIEGLGKKLFEFRPSMIVEIWNDEIGQKVEAIIARCGYRYYATDDQGPFERRPSIRQRANGRPFTNFFLCAEDVARDLNLP
jgi:FkbM family methyltransferase